MVQLREKRCGLSAVSGFCQNALLHQQELAEERRCQHGALIERKLPVIRNLDQIGNMKIDAARQIIHDHAGTAAAPEITVQRCLLVRGDTQRLHMLPALHAALGKALKGSILGEYHCAGLAELLEQVVMLRLRIKQHQNLLCQQSINDLLRFFGKQEMEILGSSYEPDEVLSFMYTICEYVIVEDIELKDGETIGFSEDQKLPIKLSEGVSVPGETLKITL